MIKNKMSKKLIYERLKKIEEVAPSAKPFIIFIEKGKKKNEWNVTEQYEALHNKTKSHNFIISDLEQYMKNNSDIPILVDYEINDNNIFVIWHVLLQLANKEELDKLVNYAIEFIDTNKKNIQFTRNLIELTKKYKEQFVNIDLKRKYDRLTKEQLRKLIEVRSKKESGKNDFQRT